MEVSIHSKRVLAPTRSKKKKNSDYTTYPKCCFVEHPYFHPLDGIWGGREVEWIIKIKTPTRNVVGWLWLGKPEKGRDPKNTRAAGSIWGSAQRTWPSFVTLHHAPRADLDTLVAHQAYQLVSPGLVICSLLLLTWNLPAVRRGTSRETGSKVTHNFQLSLGRKLANKANKTKITDDNRQTTKRIIKLNSTYVLGGAREHEQGSARSGSGSGWALHQPSEALAQRKPFGLPTRASTFWQKVRSGV